MLRNGFTAGTVRNLSRRKDRIPRQVRTPTVVRGDTIDWDMVFGGSLRGKIENNRRKVSTEDELS